MMTESDVYKRQLYKKSDRIVISTNGFFTDRIVDLCKELSLIHIQMCIRDSGKSTDNEAADT